MAAPSSRVLVLDGHPDGTSLCSALASAAAETARARGAEVKLLHLSAMQFDPNLAHGYKHRQDHEPDLQLFLDAVRWCDTLKHPLPGHRNDGLKAAVAVQRLGQQVHGAAGYGKKLAIPALGRCTGRAQRAIAAHDHQRVDAGQIGSFRSWLKREIAAAGDGCAS